ncbi:hypothetical protein CRYUN_Cryun19dG0111200 [Craigia yunnanensis]
MDDAVYRLTVGHKHVGIDLGHQGQSRRATNEVGIAMTSHLLRRYENAEVECCDRISIVPCGQTLSQVVLHRLDDESYMFERRPQLLHRLQVFLGGRAAEEVIYGRDTSRASLNYLADASWLARKILTMTVSLLRRHHAALLKAVKVLLNQKDISGEEIDFILNKYPPQTPLSLLLEEENPGSLPFIKQEQEPDLERVLLTHSTSEKL